MVPPKVGQGDTWLPVFHSSKEFLDSFSEISLGFVQSVTSELKSAQEQKSVSAGELKEKVHSFMEKARAENP